MIKSNSNTVYAKLRDNVNSLQRLGGTSDGVTRTLLLTTLALIKKRVFENGQNANGKGFGTYSQEYLNKIRKANNWSDSKITLELTGEMRREFILDTNGGNWVIGFLRDSGEESYSFKKEFTGKRKSKNNPNARKGVVKVTTTAPVSGERAEVLEKRYGTIFEMSQTEIMDFQKSFEFEVNKRLNG